MSTQIILFFMLILFSPNNLLAASSYDGYRLKISNDKKEFLVRNFINSAYDDESQRLIVGSFEFDTDPSQSQYFIYVLSSEDNWLSGKIEQKIKIFKPSNNAVANYSVFNSLGLLDLVGDSLADIVFMLEGQLLVLEKIDDRYSVAPANLTKLVTGDNVTTSLVTQISGSKGVIAASQSSDGTITLDFITKTSGLPQAMKLVSYNSQAYGMNPNPTLTYDSIAVADINSDGKEDILVAATNLVFINTSEGAKLGKNSKLSFLLNGPLAPLTIGGTINVVETSPLTIVTGDSTNYIDMPGIFKIFIGDNINQLQEHESVSAPEPHPQNLLVVDVDFDGYNDIIAAGSDSSCYVEYLGGRSSYFHNATSRCLVEENGRAFYTRKLTAGANEVVLVTTGSNIFVSKYRKR